MSQNKPQPIGFCIYCGTTAPPATRLTDEHVVPLGLNGNLILPQASCDECAKVTSRIEGFCLQQLFQNARAHLETKTRRKKKRPKTFPLGIKTPDGVEWRDVPTADQPLLIRMPQLAPAPFLTGQKNDGWLKAVAVGPDVLWTYVGFKTEEARQKWQGSEVVLNYKFAPEPFCLMLAKIAHCSAVWYVGHRQFEAFLPELIRTESSEVFDYVGGCANPLQVNRDTSFHVSVRNDPDLITVQLCMFAHLGAPYYEVVVGRRLSAKEGGI